MPDTNTPLGFDPDRDYKPKERLKLAVAMLDDGSCAYAAVTRGSQDRQWLGTAKYVGSNNGAYDGELFGIAAGLKLALQRLPAGTPTGIVRVFVDAQAALQRPQDCGPGPGQWIVPTIAGAESAILDAGWTVEFRWTPGHKDVLGNEQADRLAQGAASRQSPSEPPEITDTTSLAYVARASYYKRPKGSKTAFNTWKAVAARFIQLRLQKAPTAPNLLRTGRREDDKCWFCPEKPSQTRNHLFKTCRRWRNEQLSMWKAVAEATRDGGGKRRRKSNTSIRDLPDLKLNAAAAAFEPGWNPLRRQY
ncbi:hypothetical protein FN846DRAFT_902106 [Sphaerosporella brunnea]|uniref:RNase H type-1 domain-containing protein n=1 Tax=Sphaerosporella brunnea TaxID=1250544 RepID=A0A5J5FBK1_9PEZI|nr:hypothetical protein FN846DRAFT_902106 [Sphaerosporella brunnea]